MDGAPDEAGARTDDALGVDLQLPRFLLRRADGVFVDLTQFGGSADFCRLVDRLFLGGACFRELDYPAFLRLAFDFEPGVVVDAVRAAQDRGEPPLIRFAAALHHILPARIGLYRSVKVVRGEAHYLFEPVSLDFEIEEPVYEDGEDGEPVLVRTEKRTVAQKARLDVDEFVAQMWLKGVRFGVDFDAVAKAIAEGYVGRLVVARSVAPTAGKDAGVKELTDGLRRDDAPRVLPDGRADLTQFRNRFPQIKAGTRLLAKIPLALGTLGHEVNGRQVAPPVPKDFDLAALAGPGTKVERDGHGEAIVATMDGFLSIDNDTNQVSVMEKIVNREGVSLRTTGDLSLMGDHYEEHGEIQERRTVEGRSITALADVFGKLVSVGGTITIKQNLSGGAAINRDGPVVVEGLVNNAYIQAPLGEVTVRRAENSVIVGRRVVVQEQAVGCDILADEVVLARADGCAVAGKTVDIALARPRGRTETLVSMLLPDLEGYDRELATLRGQLDALVGAGEAAQVQVAALRGQPEVAKYLLIAGKIRKQELVLTAEQKPAFQKLADQVAPVLKALARLGEEARARAAEREALAVRADEIAAARDAATAAVSCRVAQVGGELIVRRMKLDAEAPPLASLPPAEVKARLRASSQGNSLLFSGSSGSFAWQWEPPKAAD